MPIHVWDNSDANIRVIPIDIADGVTGTAIRTYTVTGLNDVQSLVFDGTHLHATRWNDETVHVFLPSTADGQAAAVVRTYEVSGIAQPGAMAFDGTNIHIGDRQDDNFRVIAPDTANGQTATLIREYTVPGVGDMRGMTFDGTNLHIGDYSDDNFRVIAVPTAGGAQTVLRTYTVAGVNLNRAMAFDGTQLHVADITDQNFRVIAVPTTGGAQTILRTYTVTGISNARGMMLVPNTAPVFDQASYSFGNIAIAVGTVVGSVTATDADNDPLTYSLTGTHAFNFAIDSDGEVTVGVELAESTTYSFNVVVNDGTVDVTMPVTVDSVTPGPPTDATFTITPPADDVYAGQTVDFTIESNIDITDFTSDDITLTGATFVSFTLTAENTWQYRVTAGAGAGTITLFIAEDSVMPGNNAASETVTRLANPTVAITTTDADIRVDHIFTVELDWSSNVTGFANADVTVTGATKLNFTGSGRNYVLALRSSATPGDIVVTVRENAVDQRNAETSETFVNNDLATATMTPRETSIRVGRSTVVDITFTEDLTRFRQADLSVNVGTLSGLTGSGDTYEVTVTAPATGSGDITLTLPRAVTQPENHAATATIAYEPLPTVAITFGKARLGVPDSTTVTMTWSETPTGFDATDISADVGTLSGFTGSGTTYTATLATPSSGDGTITLTIPADSIDEGNVATTASINYVDTRIPPLPQLGFESFNVSVELEIEGVDVTRDMLPGQPLQYYESLDFPNFGAYDARGIQLLLDNRSGRFDTGSASNFWTDNSLPASGAGAQVLLTIRKDTDTFRFAGQVELVRQELKRKVATLVVRDLSLLLRFGVPSDFGQQLTRVITDYDGATDDYIDSRFRFKFPESLFPIAEGSLSVVIVDGMTETAVEIVDELAQSGMLSGTKAAVNYQFGYLDFEGEPADGIDTVLKCTWRVDFQYKRPDALLFELMKESGVQDALGISQDDRARYAIEKALVTRSSEVFSSHGRPYFEENGVVRWLRWNGDTWQMIQDARYVEYNEDSDEYSKVATLPVESGLDGIVLDDYGLHLTGESFSLNDMGALPNTTDRIGGVARNGDRLYFLRYQDFDSHQIVPTLLDGTVQTSEIITISPNPGTVNNTANEQIQALSIWDNHAYICYHRTANQRIYVHAYNLTTGAEDTTRGFDFARPVNNNSLIVRSIEVITDGMYIVYRPTTTGAGLRFYQHDGTFDSSQTTGLTIPGNEDTISVGINDSFFFFIDEDMVTAYTRARVRDSDSDFDPDLQPIDSDNPQVNGGDATNTRIYLLTSQITTPPGMGTVTVYRLESFQLGVAVNFGGFVPYQFDTVDNDTLYFLSANNTRGNVVEASTLRQVKVYRYVKSTDTWTDLLNEGTGQPQLSHAYQIDGEVVYLCDNRKNFQAVSRNNNTYLFYRRVEAMQSSIAYYDSSDDSITTVRSESHMGAEDYGYPYSMDFVLDERSDGIHVYTFVVRVEFANDGTYDSGSLKIYRERVEPSGAETEIYSEDFSDATADGFYPVSVSDVILADNRDKFYFVLEYHTEADEGSGQSELCTIAQDGTGSRTVIKTYDDPLVGARSPVQRGNDYFYLEGGWVRPDKSIPLDTTIPDDERHYPNQSGHLIEIDSSDAVVDHGVARRSSTRADSPDSTSEIYDGWGLHNAVISNMVTDADDNLRFVAGYGSPYNVTENLPFSSIKRPVFLLSNFHWLQWGDDLATKVPRMATQGVTYWALAEQLAEVMGWNVGFGPKADVVSDFQTAYSTVSDWASNALPFFRDPDTSTASVATLSDTDGSMFDINEKYQDIVNLYNVVRFGYAGGIQEDLDMTSIDTHGRLLLTISNALLGQFDGEWIDYLISLYLTRFASTKDLLNVSIPLDLTIEIGDRVTLNTTGGVALTNAMFRVLRRTHDFRDYRTNLLLREV